METFDGHAQVNRYDAEGLCHELKGDGKMQESKTVMSMTHGDPTVCEETVENRFLFNGQQYDPVFDTDAGQVYVYKFVAKHGAGK